ncbi:TPA: hypothetical protein SMP82_001354 [Proteus mirabilis]|nr:hypothetical protein [Proteus mirabilis]MBG2945900.1 hypothetical protein [Proteus mirabilis]HBC6252946.1 hypothetical protein [Proteus mirabilis]HEK0791617.1 hypothetical protein [Proteus mirabilis]
MDYYINTLIDDKGYYVIHQYGCEHMPITLNRMFLGNFYDCFSAMRVAIEYSYPKANGCYWCCRECHMP